VLIHELAHSTVAIKRGIPVQSITLFIFGGVSNLRADAGRAMDEFLIALVGPLTSIVLGGIAWLILQILPDGLGSLRALVTYLAITNVILGAFNLLPGFPLDGGRVLRSLVWGATRNFARATSLAATAGQALSFAFMGFGGIQLLDGHLISGLWIIFIGWFLYTAADSNRREVQAHELLRDVLVSDLMRPAMATICRDLLVNDLVSEMFLRGGHRAVTVMDEDRLVGIVTITDVARAPEEWWAEMSANEIMTRAPLLTVSPVERTAAALRLMAERDVNQVVVMDGTRAVGLLGRSDIVNYLDFRSAPGHKNVAHS